MKKLLFLTGMFFTLGMNNTPAQIMVNTFNTPLLSLSSAMTFSSNTTTKPAITSGVLTLTDNGNCESRVAAFNQKINPSSNWWLNFTYTSGGAMAADGMAMVIHSDSRGAAAIGGCGSSLGLGAADSYCGESSSTYYKISPSVAFEMNIYSTTGVAVNTNGTTGGYSGTGTLNFNSGNPIDVLMKYNASSTTLTVTMTDNVAGTSWTGSYTINLGTTVGSSAWLAFTAGSGGATATQTVSKVYFRGAKG